MKEEEQFRSIVDKMRKTAHGSAPLTELAELMRALKKRKRAFLEQRLLQRVIPWDENKERGIWPTYELAEKNKYWFLQGYPSVDGGRLACPECGLAGAIHEGFRA